jgi:hypothetical protein
MISNRLFPSLALVVLIGCGGPPAPPTHPVTGKVTWKGGEPLADGGVQLISVTDPNTFANGTVKNGDFTVFTVMDNKRVPGAILGEHVITISLPQIDQTAPPPRLKLSKTKCIVEAKENTLAIEIEKVGP